MRQTDREEQRNEDRGIGAGEAQLEEKQRDVGKDVQHMPRHWQEEGTRGEEPGQAAPGVDQREPGRGNQYGDAGEAASEQLDRALTEHGKEPAPQTRDNEQLPKRPGERAKDLPTPPETLGDK